MKPIQIFPSILSADFARLAQEFSEVERSGADGFHVDIMDGHFVPNITIGPPVVRSLRSLTKKPLDCHLMIDQPEKYVEAFAKAGADWISVHFEATDDLTALLKKIRALGCRPGAVIKPQTPFEALIPHIMNLDFVLVMTVEPGFGGQKLIPECLEKAGKLRSWLDNNRLAHVDVQIDGGVDAQTCRRAHDLKINNLVAGSAIFGAPNKDYKKAIDELRSP